jgi:hypothetical protein
MYEEREQRQEKGEGNSAHHPRTAILMFCHDGSVTLALFAEFGKHEPMCQ